MTTKKQNEPSAAPAVSIVVPTYNESEKLRRFLRTVSRQLDAPPFELIIVDDCSPDDTESVVHGWLDSGPPFHVEYVRLMHNGGPACARNEGTRRARGDIVAYTDSDCTLDRYWLAMLTRKLDAGAGVAGVGGKVLPLDPKALFGRYYTFHRALDPPESLDYLVTVNCCYLRAPVLDVGGFDESVRKPGGEDVALSLRLRQRGWRFERDTDAICYHDYRESYRNFFRTWWNYGAGTRAMLDQFDIESHDMAPPTFTLKTRYEDLRGNFSAGRKEFGLWTGARFALLRWLQLRAYQKGWESGEQRI